MSEGNIFYLNDFTQNTQYGFFSDSVSTWHSLDEITYSYNGNTYTNRLGNYWDDYTGTDGDGDGIGSPPYDIDSDQDEYPLMMPFENYVIGGEPPEPPEPPWSFVHMTDLHIGKEDDEWVKIGPYWLL